MLPVQSYSARIQQILAPVMVNGQIVPRQMRSLAEVRLYQSEITLIQKQLRALKTEITNAKKALRLHFTQASANVSNHTFTRLFSKKNAIHQSAQDRRRIQQQQHATLVPFDNLLHTITQHLLMLDTIKLDVQRQLAAQGH